MTIPATATANHVSFSHWTNASDSISRDNDYPSKGPLPHLPPGQAGCQGRNAYTHSYVEPLHIEAQGHNLCSVLPILRTGYEKY